MPLRVAAVAGAQAVEGDSDLARVIHAMALARTAVPLVEELLAKLAWERCRLEDALVEAEMGGWITPWTECPAGLAVMLSYRAADRLGLRLVGGENEATSSGRFGYRWIPARTQPRSSRASSRAGEAPVVLLESDLDASSGRTGQLDGLSDPREVDPAEYVAGVEWYAMLRVVEPRRSVAKSRDLIARNQLKFMHLVGIGARWDGEQYDVDHCGSCDDRPLNEQTYCIRCDRSGLDHIFGVPPKPKRIVANGKRPKTRRASPSRPSKKPGKAKRPLAADAP